MTNLIEFLLLASIAFLAAVVIVGFFMMRDYLQKRILNRSKDQ